MTQSYSWENGQAASARWPQQVCVTGRCEGRPGATGQDLTRPCGGSRLAPGQLLRVFSSMKRCQRTFKMKCAKGRGGDDARRARPASAATHVPGDHQLGPASAASAHFRRRHLGSCEGQRDSGEPRARGAAGAGLGAARASQSGSGDCCHPARTWTRVRVCGADAHTHGRPRAARADPCVLWQAVGPLCADPRGPPGLGWPRGRASRAPGTSPIGR